MSTTTTTRPSDPAALTSPGLPWWQAGALGLVAAVVLNTIVFAIAQVAGASFDYVDAAAAHSIGVVDVATSSTLPLAAGFLLAVALSRRWFAVLRVAQTIAAGLALVSALGPITLDTDGGTSAALAVMHLVTGAVAVASLEAYRRRRRS